MICWNIWNFRNGTVYDVETGTRESLVERINDFLNSYSSACFVFPLQTRPPAATGWQPPRAPFVKINFDAAVYDTNSVQVAAVARDSEGLCMGWSVHTCHGSPAPVMAEASASRHTILMAVERSWTHIHLEGDCIPIINALNDRTGDGRWTTFF